ncbi:MAG: hypothetical protein IKW04_01635 [Clostridia bacterium]|nr:hypothetical protein [Clostridia bacterium]
MNFTKEENEKFKSYNRAYNLYSPNHNQYDKAAAQQRKKEEEEKKKRAQKLLTRLKDLKKSAVKRGMYHQNPYKAQVAEESKNA